MRVLFDAYWWVEGPVSNRTVQREFITAWLEQFPGDDCTLLLPRDHLAIADDLPHAARAVGSRLKPHGIAMAADMPRLARRLGVDLTLTHNFAPLFGRSAVFVHDALYESNPEWFSRAERAYLSLRPRLAPRADIVFTSSHTEAARIRSLYRGVSRVEPVGLAVRTDLLAAEPRQVPGIPADFILSVGRLNVRKNLITTLRAALASGRLSPQRPLVVVGEADGRTGALPAGLSAALSDRSVIILPSVDDSELAWLYRSARLFMFLSLDEGYGLTPVEAITFGCPCLVSDLPVFRENLGDRVTYVDPLDVEAAAAALRATLDAPRGTPNRDLGLSWAACVRRMRAALERMPGQPTTRHR
ncbi:glycosyltransferase family 4 protein [uncultured Jatrophihabitans sp.]|uniref:glycosyltransferase family 4 protein n=1 Tax=uncultured Jatrophihabitans sp. TaxID=1610747 RepID=UPI0035CBE7D1